MSCFWNFKIRLLIFRLYLIDRYENDCHFMTLNEYKSNIRVNLLISFHAFESCIRRITCTPQFASWIHSSHEPYQITEIKTCTVIHCQATHLGMHFYFRNVYLNRIMEIFNAKLVQYLRPVNWANFSLNWYCICIINWIYKC